METLNPRWASASPKSHDLPSQRSVQRAALARAPAAAAARRLTSLRIRLALRPGCCGSETHADNASLPTECPQAPTGHPSGSSVAPSNTLNLTQWSQRRSSGEAGFPAGGPGRLPLENSDLGYVLDHLTQLAWSPPRRSLGKSKPAVGERFANGS